MNLDFSETEIQRYARHILLREVGGTGQARLRAARVLIVGAGGLGCPLLLYLAAAGVGTIGIIDDDVVSLSNLQRQVAHGTGDVGRLKVESAAVAARALNPLVTIVPCPLRIDAGNAMEVLTGYDIVCDGTDNFPARYVLADACHLAGKPLVSASVLRFGGQLAVFPAAGPCYRCLYPSPPLPGLIPSCAEAGVLGSVTGVLGTLQATEVLKLILNIGETLTGRLLLWDALDMRFHTVALKRDPHCVLCGSAPSIRSLAAGATEAAADA